MTAARLLLVLLTVAWAVAWPTIHLGVAAVPPIRDACLRYLIATVALLATPATATRPPWPGRSRPRPPYS